MKLIKILLLSILIFAGSCTIKLVPAYDAAILSQVGAASNQTDALYDKIIAASDKTFTTYETDYTDVSNAIQSIVDKDAVRDKGKVVLKIASDVKNRFSNYTKEHKNSGTLNDAQLRTFKNYMHALWSALYNTESHYKP